MKVSCVTTSRPSGRYSATIHGGSLVNIYCAAPLERETGRYRFIKARHEPAGRILSLADAAGSELRRNFREAGAP